MTRFAHWIAPAVVAAMLLSAPVEAGSIWARATRRAQAVYADDTAREVGDILTVIINERSVIENDVSRTLGKQSSRNAAMSGSFDMGTALHALSQKIFSVNSYTTPTADVSGSADSSFDGSADYGSDRSVTDRITVVVEDVLPNGNLVVLGKRERVITGDREVILASGIVRPSDINFDNEVDSDRVADFHLVYKNVGRENHFTRPGWFARILNFLNPS